jgi:hypothetical protein
VTVWVIWSILVSSIVMVVLGCFSSRSNGGAGLLGVSLGGMNLTWPSVARIPSRDTQRVAIVYFTQVTSPSLLVLTPINISLDLGGKSLTSFGTAIFGPFGASFRSRRFGGGGSAG